MTEANLLSEWARLLLISFVDAGVTDVVLSPGSRSSPFVVAAACHPRLRCHDAWDERSAAFFALGQARVTGRPSVLICTSGTAGAHYLPAIIEANYAHLPLVVLTADRPFELQDCGAPQTIDQAKLFGDAVRRFYELGLPDQAPQALKALRRLVAQAVHLSTSPRPGPVHLNARARKPLEPQEADTAAEHELQRHVDELLERPIVRAHAPALRPDPEAVAAAAACCRQTSRGLIVCGPAPVAQAAARPAIFALAAATGYPLLAEAGSQLRFAPRSSIPANVIVCDAFDALLRIPGFGHRNQAEFVIQLGATPVSGGWGRYSATLEAAERVVIAPYGWYDPDSLATTMVFGDVALTAAELAKALEPTPWFTPRAVSSQSQRRTPWAETFAAANQRVWDVVTAELVAGNVNHGPRWTEGHVIDTVVRALPAGSLLMLGNSLPVREVDTFCPTGAADVAVLTQRGVNGIDGLVAGAVGAASVADRPVTLLMGDVSFLHDLGALGLASQVDVPLVIVVIQNNGGRIFEQLPLASAPGVSRAIMEHVITPHTIAFKHAALLFGHGYALADSLASLTKALKKAYTTPSCTLIEAKVSPHSASEQHQRILAAVERAVRPLVAGGSER